MPEVPGVGIRFFVIDELNATFAKAFSKFSASIEKEIKNINNRIKTIETTLANSGIKIKRENKEIEQSFKDTFGRPIDSATKNIQKLSKTEEALTSALRSQSKELANVNRVIKAEGESIARLQAKKKLLQTTITTLTTAEKNFADVGIDVSKSLERQEQNLKKTQAALKAFGVTKKTVTLQQKKDSAALAEQQKKDFEFFKAATRAEKLIDRERLKSKEKLISVTKKLNKERERTSKIINKNRAANAGLIGSLKEIVFWQLRWFTGAGLVFGIINQITGSVKDFFVLEDTMQRIAGIFELNAQETEKFKDQINDLARVTGTAPSEVAMQFLEIGRAIPDATEALDILTNAMKLQVVAGGELSSSVNALRISQTVWGDAAGTTEQIANKLTFAFDKSALATEDMSNIFNIAGASAKLMGVSFDDLLAVAAVLRDAGLRGQTIATGLRVLVRDLTLQSDKLTNALGLTKDELIKIIPEGSSLADVLEFLNEKGVSTEQLFGALTLRGANVGATLTDLADKVRIARDGVGSYNKLNERFVAQLGTAVSEVKKLGTEFDLLVGQILGTTKGFASLFRILTGLVQEFTLFFEILNKIGIKLPQILAAIAIFTGNPIVVAVAVLANLEQLFREAGLGASVFAAEVANVGDVTKITVKSLERFRELMKQPPEVRPPGQFMPFDPLPEITEFDLQKRLALLTQATQDQLKAAEDLNKKLLKSQKDALAKELKENEEHLLKLIKIREDAGFNSVGLRNQLAKVRIDAQEEEEKIILASLKDFEKQKEKIRKKELKEEEKRSKEREKLFKKFNETLLEAEKKRSKDIRKNLLEIVKDEERSLKDRENALNAFQLNREGDTKEFVAREQVIISDALRLEIIGIEGKAVLEGQLAGIKLLKEAEVTAEILDLRTELTEKTIQQLFNIARDETLSIEERLRALDRLNERDIEVINAFTTGWVNALVSFGNVTNSIIALGEQTATILRDTFKDVFVAGLKGQFEDIGDLFDALMDKMLDAFLNTVATMASNSLISAATGVLQQSGITSGLSAALGKAGLSSVADALGIGGGAAATGTVATGSLGTGSLATTGSTAFSGGATGGGFGAGTVAASTTAAPATAASSATAGAATGTLAAAGAVAGVGSALVIGGVLIASLFKGSGPDFDYEAFFNLKKSSFLSDVTSYSGLPLSGWTDLTAHKDEYNAFAFQDFLKTKLVEEGSSQAFIDQALERVTLGIKPVEIPSKSPPGNTGVAQANFAAAQKLKELNSMALPSFQKGLINVPFDNFKANLHEGEMVLPKQISEAVRDNLLTGAGGSSGITVVFETNVSLPNSIMVGESGIKQFVVENIQKELADNLDDHAGEFIRRLEKELGKRF